MNRPTLALGKSPWGLNDKKILDYVDSIRPLSGLGTKVFDAAGGRVINATPSVGGNLGPSLHNIVGLAGKIPDTIKIVAQVVEEIIGGVEIPDPWEFISELSDAFVDVLHGGDIPEIDQVEEWVDGLLEGTLDNLVGDIPAAINDVLSGLFDGAPDIFSSYFGAPGGVWPRGGDYIFTGGAGICYMVFRKEDEMSIVPSIFQIPFTVGTGDQAQEWVAMTLVPVPDISALVTAATSLLTTSLNSILNIASNLLVASIMSVFYFVAEIGPFIDTLLNLLWEAIDDLWEFLLALTDRVTTIEGLLENITTAEIINTAGYTQTVTVLGATEQVPFATTHKFIDPETGGTYEADALLWTIGTPGGNTDFKKFYWLGQDGVRWGADVLMNTAEGYPKVEDTPTASGTLFGRGTKTECGGNTFDILEAEHEE